jgi:hypothetical protein
MVISSGVLWGLHLSSCRHGFTILQICLSVLHVLSKQTGIFPQLSNKTGLRQNKKEYGDK